MLNRTKFIYRQEFKYVSNLQYIFRELISGEYEWDGEEERGTILLLNEVEQ